MVMIGMPTKSVENKQTVENFFENMICLSDVFFSKSMEPQHFNFIFVLNFLLYTIAPTITYNQRSKIHIELYI